MVILALSSLWNANFMAFDIYNQSNLSGKTDIELSKLSMLKRGGEGQRARAESDVLCHRAN